MSQYPDTPSFLREKSSYSLHHCLLETQMDSCISGHVFGALFSHQLLVLLPQVFSLVFIAQIQLDSVFSEWRMAWQRYDWISLSNPTFSEKNYSCPDMERSNRSDTCYSDSEMWPSMKYSEHYCSHSRTWSQGPSWSLARATLIDSHFQQVLFGGQPSSDSRPLHPLKSTNAISLEPSSRVCRCCAWPIGTAY